jgi:hypothetical protein
MTPNLIANRTWDLWNDYYKENDNGSDFIITEIEKDIKEFNKEMLIKFHDWMLNSSDYDINAPAEIKASQFLSTCS